MQSHPIQDEKAAAEEARIFAQQIMHECRLAFLSVKINPEDVDKPDFSPSLNFWNRLDEFVVEDILSQADLDKRSAAMNRWILAMEECKNEGDLHSSSAIYAALQRQAIFRLHATKSNLPKNSLALLKNYKEPDVTEYDNEKIICIRTSLYENLFGKFKELKKQTSPELHQEKQRIKRKQQLAKQKEAEYVKNLKITSPPLDILKREPSKLVSDEKGLLEVSKLVELETQQLDFFTQDQIPKIPVIQRIFKEQKEFKVKKFPENFFSELNNNLKMLINKREAALEALAGQFKAVGFTMDKKDFEKIDKQQIYRALLPEDFIALMGDQQLKGSHNLLSGFKTNTYTKVTELAKVISEINHYDIDTLNKMENLVKGVGLKVDAAKLQAFCEERVKLNARKQLK